MAIVIIDRHEPEGEVAQRLLELAEEKGHDARSVEAVRGEHDATLSFRVPDDVAEAFNAERSDAWPSKIENDDEKDAGQPTAAVNEDAVAADNTRTATAARVANTEQAEADKAHTKASTTTDRKSAKSKE